MRIAELIHRSASRLTAASIDDTRLETEVLMAYVLGIDRAHLLARLADELDADTNVRFDAVLARRIAHEPLAYITRHREFYGIDIACRPGALIPRPETEMLVEIALDEILRRGDALRIADVGTGSGAIAVAIAVHAPRARVTAIDASDAALTVARDNAARVGVADRIDLRTGDLLEDAGVFDVIVANLPYVSAAEWQELQPEIRDHEPREALVGGPAGTEVIERLLRQAPSQLEAAGVLAAEMGYAHGARLLAVAGACFPDAEACVIKDVAGLDRVLLVRRGG